MRNKDDFRAVWDALAYERIAHLAATRKAFSTDDVWTVLDPLPKPDDPRALGPLVVRARNEGLLEKSDLVAKSDRDVCHDRPIAVWLSRALGGTVQDALAYVLRKKRTLAMPEELQLNLHAPTSTRA